MSANARIRQSHRWLSIAFTVGAVVNGIAVARGKQTVWVGMLSFLPLVGLQLTGLILLVKHCAARWRRERPSFDLSPSLQPRH